MSGEEASGLFTGWSDLRAYPTFRILGDFFLLLESNRSDTFFSVYMMAVYMCIIERFCFGRVSGGALWLDTCRPWLFYVGILLL